MGIRGLTSYINNRSDYYLENYELNNTKLVIDGWSLSSQLYGSTHHNWAFGGDYDRFANTVTIFFKELLRCQVTPLVILDGGWENKKYFTLLQRFKDRLNVASTVKYNFNSQQQCLFSLMISEVFLGVLKKMKIQYLMCTFEADNSIAGLARVLNCPVLSYDSDFFIYGATYIPIDTLDPYIIKNNKGYVKRCKIFKTQKLLNNFKGLDLTLLPLASILLGNDYIDEKIFKNFFLRILSRNKSKYTTQQKKIEITFNWLKNYSLNEAIEVIMVYIPEKIQSKVLHDMELIINNYSNVSTHIFHALGFDEKFIDEVKTMNKIFTCEKFEIKNEKTIDEKLLPSVTEDEFAASIPSWYLKNHVMGHYPPYFVNIITHQKYITMVQIEKMSSPSAQNISFPIIKKIASLLLSLNDKNNDNNDEDTTLQLVTRQESQLITVNLTIQKSLFNAMDFEKLDFVTKKQIIDETLGIKNDYNLEELPQSWILYTATMLYWIHQNDDLEKSKIHVNCLLLSMIMDVITTKIGYCRTKKSFEKKFSNQLAQFLNTEKPKNNIKICDSRNIMNIINSVSEENCIAALQFFIDHYDVDKSLRIYPDKFQLNVVHIFSQFQSCLKHSMHLNALLNYVYVQPSPGDFFNGTLLYNLHENLKTRQDIDSYIHVRLKDSPEIIQLLELLKSKIFGILDNNNFIIDDGEKNLRRKRKKNKNSKPCTKSDDSNLENTIVKSFDDENCNSFYTDPNNRFASLAI